MPLGGLIPYPPKQQDDAGVARTTALGQSVLGTIEGQAAANTPDAPIYKSVTYQSDGTVDVKGASPALQEFIQRSIQKGQMAERAVEETIARVSAERQVLERNPIISSLGRIASGAAIAYQAPGSRAQELLRGIGYAGADLFSKTPAELSAREAELRLQQLAIQQSVGKEALGVAAEERRERRAEALELAAQEQLKINQRKAKLDEYKALYSPHEQLATQGVDSSESFAADARAALMPEAEIATRVKGLQALARVGNERRMEDRAWRESQATLEHNRAIARINAEKNVALQDRQTRFAFERYDSLTGRMHELTASSNEARQFFSNLFEGSNLPAEKRTNGNLVKEEIERIRQSDPINGNKLAAQFQVEAARRQTLIDSGRVDAELASLDKQRRSIVGMLNPQLQQLLSQPVDSYDIAMFKSGLDYTNKELKAAFIAADQARGAQPTPLAAPAEGEEAPAEGAPANPNEELASVIRDQASGNKKRGLLGPMMRGKAVGEAAAYGRILREIGEGLEKGVEDASKRAESGGEQIVGQIIERPKKKGKK